MTFTRRSWLQRTAQILATFPPISALVGRQLKAQPTEIAGNTFSETDAGEFDWDQVIARRPIFSVDYFKGYSSVRVDGRADWGYDLKRISHYADPVIFRGCAIDPVHSDDWLDSPQLVFMPDLFDEANVESWLEKVRRQWAPLIAKFKQYRCRVVPLTIYFNLFGGAGYSPDWYRRRVPDFQEMPADGQTHAREREMKDTTCLAHPQLYEVAERYWKLVSRVMDDSLFIATCVDNEPRSHYRMGAKGLGGNPHTKALFREFLQQRHGDLNLFNLVAKTSYSSFDQVDIGTDNWLVHLYAQRFRFWLVHGYYMRKLIEGLRRNTQLKAVTRLDPRHNTSWGGVDLSYVQEMMPDVIGFSFSPRIDNQRKEGEEETDLNYRRERLGRLSVIGGVLRGVGRPLGITEPLFRRMGGNTLSTPRDYEFLHLIYRGLYYRLGIYNLHSWSRPAPVGRPEIRYPLYNYFFGLSHAHKPKLLKMIHQVREELDRISPFTTFGQPVAPPVAILLTRNSTYFSGLGESFYGDVCYRLAKLMEDPEWCLAEVVEEHDDTLESRLSSCRGIIVVGNGLEASTRELLAEAVRRGVKIFWWSAPAHINSSMAPLEFEDWLPVSSMEAANFSELYKFEPVTWVQGPWLEVDAARLEALTDTCHPVANHPLLAELPQLKLFAPVGLQPRRGANPLLQNGRDGVVGAVREGVAFLAGMPMQPDQQRQLYLNFLRWCGLQPPKVVISQFEHATVAQYFDPRIEDNYGNVRGPDWYGSVAMADNRSAGLWEVRKDIPWLAYHHEGDRTVVEGVRLKPLEVTAFRKEESREMPHFEHLSEGVGIDTFWYDPFHIVAQLSVASDTQVTAKFAPAHWGDKPFRWFVFDQSTNRRVAEGDGRNIRFSAKSGVSYILGARYQEGHLDSLCFLCNTGRFR